MIYSGGADCDVQIRDGFELCGTHWQSLALAGGTPAYSDDQVTEDTVRHVAVLFDGATTWEFRVASGWVQVASGPEQGVLQFAIAFDAARRRTVLFGGFDAFSRAGVTDTWEWDGDGVVAHVTRAAGIRPSATARSPTTSRARVEVVPTDSGTWEYDGISWHRRDTLHPPPVAFGYAYDPARRVVIAMAPDPGEYDGTDWTTHVAAHHPPVDIGHQAIIGFDSLHGQIVTLVGGLDFSSRTWVFDGVDWRELDTGLGAIVDASMAFDSAARRGDGAVRRLAVSSRHRRPQRRRHDGRVRRRELDRHGHVWTARAPLGGDGLRRAPRSNHDVRRPAEVRRAEPHHDVARRRVGVRRRARGRRNRPRSGRPARSRPTPSTSRAACVRDRGRRAVVPRLLVARGAGRPVHRRRGLRRRRPRRLRRPLLPRLLRSVPARSASIRSRAIRRARAAATASATSRSRSAGASRTGP